MEHGGAPPCFDWCRRYGVFDWFSLVFRGFGSVQHGVPMFLVGTACCVFVGAKQDAAAFTRLLREE